MSIVLRTVMAGPDGTHQPGEKLTMDADEERRLVDGGYAVYDKPASRGETASMSPPEDAALAPVTQGKPEPTRRIRR